MTAAEDFGAPTHVVAPVAGGRAGPIALYEAAMCTVVATTSRIAIVPADSWLHAVLARQPEAVEHHLAAAVDIVFPAATNGDKLDP